MLLQLDSDLEFFRETTDRFLSEKAPPHELRRLRDSDSGFEANFWRQGADLGWTSLLVDEAHGGGSISGDRLVDLSVVAHEFGGHAAPGPLGPSNIVAGALSRHGQHLELLADLLAGSAVATWAISETVPHSPFGSFGLEIAVDGDEFVLNGTKRPVESAAESTHILVTGRTGGGLTQVLVPVASRGLTLRPMSGVDLTRRFSVVEFADVRIPAEMVVGAVGHAREAVEHQLRQGLVILNAESVGAMQAGFDMTLEWAIDRYSFGRPLASYQAIKHRFADMKSWLEAGHALSDNAAAAVSAEADDADELLSAAKSFIGEFGGELLQECVQLHGGIGLTFEHDLHLFLRRHTTNRALLGTPADHRRRLAELVIARENAA
ncbi:MAG: acyl-CoA/acyl-ACP dehydrogenase [Acidimicrobiales bacterium]|nr:acyl-CoA/acyl-ACP dehydrogenase [Acidimicrobiales bacterium]